MNATAAATTATRLCLLCVLCLLASACSRAAALFKQYEYEEEVYLSLDGTATVYVHSSVAALNALRGTSLDTNPAAAIDRAAIRDYFSSPATHVTWVRPSRRGGRRFMHVRLEVADVRKLSEAAPLAWSTYRFEKRGGLFAYHQTVRASAASEVGNVGWTGREIVAFRLHLPSKIGVQNSGGSIGRGNILAWEQPLTDRLRGVPLEIDAEMDPQSILYRTLWLFAATFAAVAAAFGVVIWWVMRRGPATIPVEANPR